MKSAITTINNLLKEELFFPVLLALILSSLCIGYAISSILLGVFVGLSFINFLIQRKLKFQKELILPILLYLWFIASYMWSFNQDYTLKGIGRMAGLAIIPLAFAALPQFNQKQCMKVLEIFSYFNLAYGILFLISAGINYFETKTLSVFTYHDLVGIFDLNAIYVSTFFLISFVYFFIKKQQSFFTISASIFLFFLLVLLASKMVMFILILVLLFKAFQLLKTNNTKTGIAAGLAIVILLTLIFTIKPIKQRYIDETRTNISEILESDTFGQAYIWTGTSIRLLQLRILADQIKEEAIVLNGFGLFASRENLRDRHIGYKTYYGFHKYNYHNQYAQMIAELGLVGLLILILVLGFNLQNAIKSKNVLFGFFAVYMILIFVTESMLWRQRGLFFFLILYCLFNRTQFNHQQVDGKHKF